MRILGRNVPPHQQGASKNFNYEEIRTRVQDEAAVVYNRAQQNAIEVHGTPIRYFSKLQSGFPCSCTVKSNTTGANLPAVGDDSTVTKPYRFDFQDVMLGEKNETDTGLFEDDMTELQQPPAKDINRFNPNDLLEDLFDNGVDCGCCYRTRIAGGFEEVGTSRQVFTHYNLKRVEGYFKDETKSPSAFVETSEGLVEFECHVPRYFKRIEYQVMNNTELVESSLFKEDGSVLTLADCQAVAGQPLVFQVRKVNFTHVVLTFFLPVKGLKADFPQDSRNVDYTALDTISQSQAVVSSAIPATAKDDVLLKLDRTGAVTSVWTVTDRTYFRLENGYNVGWTLTCRTAQAEESLSRIWVATRLK